MNFDQPVHKDAPHFFIDIGLLFHVIAVGLVVQLSVKTVVVDINRLKRTVEGVKGISHITCFLATLEVNAVHY